jgi:glyoxylase-like metal-dependent hydrolase (beta-lactamase superfamily II)
MGLPIADRWFERKRIDDEITLLWEPHVDPLVRCNIWHVRGRDRDALIDSGLGVASLKAAADDLFERDVVAVATHIHYDHVGSLHEFEHRICIGSKPPRWPTTARAAACMRATWRMWSRVCGKRVTKCPKHW